MARFTLNRSELAHDGFKCVDYRLYIDKLQKSDKQQLVGVILSTYRLTLDAVEILFPSLRDFSNVVQFLLLHGEKNESRLIQFHSFVQQRRNKVSIWDVFPQYLSSEHVTETIFTTKGVHHPKYILLFTNTALHVIITSANFNGSDCTDASWIQSFPLASNASDTECGFDSDFGKVLSDFLMMQSKQLREPNLHDSSSNDDFDDDITVDESDSERSVIKWLQNKLNIHNLATHFDFSKAEVELISTVPCRQPLRSLSEEERQYLLEQSGFDLDLCRPLPCEQCQIEEQKLLKDSNVLYGSNRVRQVLLKHRSNISEKLLSDLVVQQTSIGQNINVPFIDLFLESLMPEARWNDVCAVDDTCLDHCQLIWPSMALMLLLNNDFNLTTTVNEPDSQQPDMPAVTDELREGILFLHPETFATMEPDIQSRFYTYEVTQVQALQGIVNKTPHIKTYSRLMRKPRTSKEVGDSNPQDEEASGSTCTCYDLAWTWLTSACLSRGAQGVHVPYSVCYCCGQIRSGYWDYKNFELGLIFNSNHERQYRALCGTCPIHTSSDLKTASLGVNDEKKVIILPFPFDIGEAQPYCNELNQLQRCPFFYPASEVRKFVPECADEAELMMNESALTRRSSSILGKRTHTMAEFIRSSSTITNTTNAVGTIKRHSTGNMSSSRVIQDTELQSWMTSSSITATSRTSLPFSSAVINHNHTTVAEMSTSIENKPINLATQFTAKREVIIKDVMSIADFI